MADLHELAYRASGEEQMLLAADCAFNDQQVTDGSAPEINENLSLTQQTYARLRALRDVKPTTMLFTHDWDNHDKLASQFSIVSGDGTPVDGGSSN